MVRNTRGTISWRPERGAFFVRWVGLDGKRRQARGGTTQREARATLDAIFEEERRRAGGVPVPRRLAQFLSEDHLPMLATRLAEKVYDTRKARLVAVAQILGHQAMCDVRRVDADRVFVELATRPFKIPRAKRKAGKLRSPATLFQYRSALVVCWNAAIDAGFATDNPWRGVKLPRMQEYSVRYLSEEDLAKLYAAADERLRPFLVVLGETAMRRGEALALQWSDVARDLSTVTVRRSKSGRVRAIPLTELARRTLKALAGGPIPRTEDRVFSLIGESWTLDTRKAWVAALRASGLPRVRLHDLRHARASLLVRAGVPVPTVSAWLGHATPQLVLSRYGHHAPANHLHQALELLEQRRGEAARAAAPRLSDGSATPVPPGSPGAARTEPSLEPSPATP